MKDTIENRMKAIESLNALGFAFDIGCAVHMNGGVKKLSRERLEEFVVEAEKIITKTLSHGWNSRCCKGKGFGPVEDLVKQYFGESHGKD